MQILIQNQICVLLSGSVAQSHARAVPGTERRVVLYREVLVRVQGVLEALEETRHEQLHLDLKCKKVIKLVHFQTVLRKLFSLIAMQDCQLIVK